MNAMHSHLNGSNTVVHDVRTIWSAIQSPVLAEDARRLLKWFAYAYQFNQGRMFGLSPSLASLESIDIEFSRLLANLPQNDPSAYVWKDEFKIPSEDALLTIDPNYLFEVRDGEAGAAYFEAVDNWQRNQSDETCNVLLDRLGAYVSELNRLYIAKGRSLLNWEWRINARIPEGKIWNKTAFEIAKEAIGEIIPHFGLLSLVGPLGAATYEWWPEFARKGMGITNRIRMEVETQTKRIQPVQEQTTEATFK